MTSETKFHFLKASRLLALSFVFLPGAVFAQDTYSKASDAAIYAEHSFQTFIYSNPGEVLNLKRAIDEYVSRRESGDPLSREELQELLNRGEAEADALNELARNVNSYKLGGDTREYIEDVADLVDGGASVVGPQAGAIGGGAKIVKAGSRLVFRIGDKVYRWDAQIGAQAEHLSSVELFHQVARKQFLEVHALAAEDPEVFGSAIDSHLSTTSKVTTKNTKEEVFAVNPDLANAYELARANKQLGELLDESFSLRVRVDRNFEQGVSMGLQLERIEDGTESLREGQEQIREGQGRILESDRLTRAVVVATSEYVIDQTLEGIDRLLDEREYEQWVNSIPVATFENYLGFVQTFAIALGQTKAANVVTQLGSGILDIYRSFNNLRVAEAAFKAGDISQLQFSSFGFDMMGSVLTFGSLISGLLGDGGPSTLEIILDALAGMERRLSFQISELGRLMTEVHQANTQFFRIIDHRLEQQMLLTARQMHSIGLLLQESNLRLAEIANAVGIMRRELLDVRTLVVQSARAQNESNILTAERKLRAYIRGDRLDEDNFIDLTSLFVTQALDTSSSVLYQSQVSPSLAVNGFVGLDSVLRQVDLHGRLLVVGQFSRGFGNTGLDGMSWNQIGNAFAWYRGAQSVQSAASFVGEDTKILLDPADISKMIDRGVAIQVLSYRLLDEGGKVAFGKMLEKLEEMAAQIVEAVRTTYADAFKDALPNGESRDLVLRANLKGAQTVTPFVAASINTMTACSASPHFSAPVPIPADVRRHLNDNYGPLTAMGLSFQICYEIELKTSSSTTKITDKDALRDHDRGFYDHWNRFRQFRTSGGVSSALNYYDSAGKRKYAHTGIAGWHLRNHDFYYLKRTDRHITWAPRIHVVFTDGGKRKTLATYKSGDSYKAQVGGEIVSRAYDWHDTHKEAIGEAREWFRYHTGQHSLPATLNLQLPSIPSAIDQKTKWNGGNWSHVKKDAEERAWQLAEVKKEELISSAGRKASQSVFRTGSAEQLLSESYEGFRELLISYATLARLNSYLSDDDFREKINSGLPTSESIRASITEEELNRAVRNEVAQELPQFELAYYGLVLSEGNLPEGFKEIPHGEIPVGISVSIDSLCSLLNELDPVMAFTNPRCQVYTDRFWDQL